jgi:hypothetical protein
MIFFLFLFFCFFVPVAHGAVLGDWLSGFGSLPGYGVAVAGWQWVEWTGEVLGIILSGDKLKIGAILMEIW